MKSKSLKALVVLEQFLLIVSFGVYGLALAFGVVYYSFISFVYSANQLASIYSFITSWQISSFGFDHYLFVHLASIMAALATYLVFVNSEQDFWQDWNPVLQIIAKILLLALVGVVSVMLTPVYSIIFVSVLSFWPISLAMFGAISVYTLYKRIHYQALLA